MSKYMFSININKKLSPLNNFIILTEMSIILYIYIYNKIDRKRRAYTLQGAAAR